MYPKLKIGGNDITASWLHQKARIVSTIGQRIDTATLEIEDTTGSISIDELDEVILSNNAETTRYFAGEVGAVEIEVVGVMKVFKLRCYDYTKLLDRIVINEVYEDSTAAAILSSAFSEYASDFDATTYVETGYTFDRLVCNRITLAKLVTMLADACGFDWYVDYNKKLHFFSQEAAQSAPFGLSDSPDYSTTYPYEMKRYVKDGSNIKNRVTVRGGSYLSSDTDFEFAGDGQNVVTLLGYKMRAPDGETGILVYRNTGSDVSPSWTAQGVGVDYIDELGGAIDVLFNYQEKLLRWGSAPPDLDRAVKIHCKYEAPVLVRVRSEESYIDYGRWYDDVIRDPDLSSQRAAQLAGKAMLAESALAQEQITATTQYDGLTTGVFVTITDTIRGISDSYIVRKLTTRFLGNQVAEYTVDLGKYYKDLYDLIAELRRNSDPWVGQEDDGLLNEMFDIETETVAFSDATPSATETDKSSYYCGATGDNQPIMAGYWTVAA